MSENPFDLSSWLPFWYLCEAEAMPWPKTNPEYDTRSECDYCDDWYNCPDCPARLDAEAEDEAEERFAEEEDYVP